MYINPEEIDQEAIDVHGITNEFLADKPNFAGIVDEFVEFIREAELLCIMRPSISISLFRIIADPGSAKYFFIDAWRSKHRHFSHGEEKAGQTKFTGCVMSRL